MSLPYGIFSSANNALISIDNDIWHIEGAEGETIRLEFVYGPAFVLQKKKGQWFVLPMSEEYKCVKGDTIAWVLPLDSNSGEASWMIKAEGSISVATDSSTRIIVEVASKSCELRQYESRPHADCFGSRYSFSITHGYLFEKAMAGFYWDTMLPCVVERTKATDLPISDTDGFVLSALVKGGYAGTYPDVDHEFQIKGRIVMGNDLDYSVVRRMMDLQLKLMREDPEGLWRNPCSILEDGTREYHVRRRSLDNLTNAIMFLVTGNVEILESAWLYAAVTKDMEWLQSRISDLEGAASCIEDYIDRNGRLWSDVYYEDQVIKDGRESFATALASNSFKLLAELEAYLGRSRQSEYYTNLSVKLSQIMIKPLPVGYWDPENRRFIDWVDRSGKIHDHIHLLANILPVLFGYASDEQVQAVYSLMHEKFDEFQRFPSFVAADIGGYTKDEIGVGGPYDLCAAGRYWCWDAAFWSYRKCGNVLKEQLYHVANEAQKDSYIMGERYDMNYIYYIDDKNWHGCGHYYEYPCVFSWVLIHEYIGVRFSLEADLCISPRLDGYGSIRLESPHLALYYEYREDSFILKNLAACERSFKIDLSALYPHAKKWRIETAQGDKNTGMIETVNIPGGQQTCFYPL